MERTPKALGSNAEFVASGSQSGLQALARIERFRLQAIARGVLPPAKFPRMGKCLRTRRAPEVTVHRSKAHGRAFYGGLVTCASVWNCPCCAPKISERRKVELKACTKAAAARGYQAHLVTFTFPHTAGDRLAPILGQVLEAWRWMLRHRRYREWKEAVGLVGTVRALEVTHGDVNGWHPHFHVITFTKGPTSPVEALAALRDVWALACLAKGLPRPSDAVGVDVRGANAAVGDYVAKWGVEAELTKAHIKRAVGARRTPFDLLRMAGGADEQDRERGGRLFREFAEAFKGRSQLQWSRGLRAHLGLEAEKDDEQLAEEKQDQAEALASLEAGQWFLVYQHPRWGDLRGQLLEAANVSDETLVEMIAALVMGDYAPP